MAEKLNEIDERYNARTMAVGMNPEGNYHLANIEIKVIEEESEAIAEAGGQRINEIEKEDEEEADNTNDDLSEITPNHMITLVDIPEEDVILVADATNPSLGMYEKGKIKMFNSDKELKTSEIYTMFYHGYEGLEIGESFIDSFTNGKSYEELKEEYGLEKQNEALEYVRGLEEKTQEQKFREALRVGWVPEANKHVLDAKRENMKMRDSDMQL